MGSAFEHFDGAVIVAMIAMGMMEMTINQVINVIAVRDGFVTATGAMDVARFMAIAMVLRRATVGVCVRYGDYMFIHVVFMWMMKMTIVQIVDMPFVTDGGMAAVGSMNMVMIGVVREVACAHGIFLMERGVGLSAVVIRWHVEECSEVTF